MEKSRRRWNVRNKVIFVACLLFSLCLTFTAFGRVRHRTTSPSFTDTFQNLDNWIVSNWGPTEGTENGNTSYFVPANVGVTSQGLALTLTQTINPDGTITSLGGEVQSKQLFGYGTYTWTMKVAEPAVPGQVSAGFNFVNNSQTEIDFEVEGQNPNTVAMTAWSGLNNSVTRGTYLQFPEQEFHNYTFVWSSGSIQFYIDGTLIKTETTVVPTAPAYVMINLWGTNSVDWGGAATTGLTRTMYVKGFQYTP